MQAVASSATAMQAVAASPVAIAAIYRSDVALSAVDSEVSAAATFYGADSVAMGKAVVILAGLDPAGYADMSAVAASATAMSAVAANYVALVALYSNAEALSTAQGTTVGAAALAGAGSVATGKAAAKLAGLDPDDFADMAAVAASSTAMAAVAASTTALDVLYAKKKRMSGGGKSLSGKFIILEISNQNAFNVGKYGYATLSDGSQPDWGNYIGKYAYFKQYKMYATYIRNDTDSDDWIDYFQVS